MKKISATEFFYCTMILWIASAIFIYLNLDSLALVVSEPVDVKEALENPKERMLVTVDVDKVIDLYSTVEEKRHGGAPKDEVYNYIILLEDGTIMSISVNDSKNRALNEIGEVTWDCINGVSSELHPGVEFMGILKKMDSDNILYFDTCLKHFEYNGYEFSGEIYYWTIETTHDETQGFLCLCVIGFLVILGFICLVIGIIKTIILKHRRRHYEGIGDRW